MEYKTETKVGIFMCVQHVSRASRSLISKQIKKRTTMNRFACVIHVCMRFAYLFC